jgi:hypothetical protein
VALKNNLKNNISRRSAVDSEQNKRNFSLKRQSGGSLITNITMFLRSECPIINFSLGLTEKTMQTLSGIFFTAWQAMKKDKIL